MGSYRPLNYCCVFCGEKFRLKHNAHKHTLKKHFFDNYTEEF